MRRSNEEWVYRAAGCGGGLLLAAGNLWGILAPLQLTGFLPVLLVDKTYKPGRQGLFLMGLYMGLAYTLPQMFVLRLPAPITAILIAVLTTVMVADVMLGVPAARRSPVNGAVAFASILVVVDGLNFTLVPMWGTAQSLGRCWSAYPRLIWFSGMTGITGMVFFIGLFQAFLAYMIVHRMAKSCFVFLLSICLCLAGGKVLSEQIHTAESHMVVAAVGWVQEESSGSTDLMSSEGFEELYASKVALAAQQGARLVVSPELAFEFSPRNRTEWLERFAGLSVRHHLFQIVGYYNQDQQDNRILFLSDTGEVLCEYVKTHLTPFEPFPSGGGHLQEIVIDGVPVGGMICQDDNFTDLSRRYGKRGIGVVAVPTLDWRAVQGAHLQNSIHRAIESNYAVVRAACDGISTIIGPDGRILAAMDHFRQGPGVIVSQIPVRRGITWFSRWGHWPAAFAALFLTGWMIIQWGKSYIRRHATQESSV
ncbi:MAG: hypothetical protein JW828_04725 [Sedimentisphaerales bacterium]|nr:hypothetical protein [Sedimentisphaerales bacterium]